MRVPASPLHLLKVQGLLPKPPQQTAARLAAREAPHFIVFGVTLDIAASRQCSVHYRQLEATPPDESEMPHRSRFLPFYELYKPRPILLLALSASIPQAKVFDGVQLCKVFCDLPRTPLHGNNL